MLNGDIDIGQNLRRIADGRDELVRHPFGLQVENANPYALRTHRARNGNKQLGKVVRPLPFLRKVFAPDTRILADEHDLANAGIDKVSNLREDALGRTRMVAAADIGNGAEAAEPVAAVGNLHVRDGPLNGALDIGNESGGRATYAQKAIDNGNDAVLFIRAHEGGNLGQLAREVVTVTGGYAAAHDDGNRTNAVRNLLGQRERRLDALLRCRGQKGAGVNDGEVGLRNIVCNLIASREKQ